MTRITCWRLKPKSTRNWFLVLSKNVVGPESKPRSVTSNCASLTKRFVPKKKRGNGGKPGKTGYRPLGKLFLIVFVVFFPAGQACFLALIVWHWQQAACSDTHRSNESPPHQKYLQLINECESITKIVYELHYRSFQYIINEHQSNLISSKCNLKYSKIFRNDLISLGLPTVDRKSIAMLQPDTTSNVINQVSNHLSIKRKKKYIK